MALSGVDLFGGAGGWDIAAGTLGVDVIGIEIDDAACEMRSAAGLRTHQGDVSKVKPTGPVDLLIASPPCPTFSAAGNGGGRRLTEVIVSCLHELAAGNDTRFDRRLEAFSLLLPIYDATERERAKKKQREPDLTAAGERARRDADMSLLVVEPMRWIVALKPRWIALEQVPEVLPLWSQMAQILSYQFGYSTFTAIMEAERYGVPQTRERAILMADREGPVHPPRPTHQRYVKGEPQRHEVTLEGEVLPWVSMAEALGWLEGEHPSPAPTVSGGGTGAGGGVEVFAGREARNRVRQSVKLVNGNQDNATERDADEPASTVAFGHNSARIEWVYDRRQNQGPPDNRTPVPPVPTSEPAPTLSAQGLAKGRDVWRMEKKEDRPERTAQGAGNQPRYSTEPAATIDTRADLSKWTRERPAPTIITTRRSDEGIIVGRQLPEGEGRNVGGHNWPSERPSTTVNGDSRISKPGRHDPEESGSQQKDAVRVTLEEAAILQSFPPDYPFQGSKGAKFTQCGNAVPVGLALPILGELLGIDWRPIHAEYLATYARQTPTEAAA